MSQGRLLLHPVRLLLLLLLLLAAQNGMQAQTVEPAATSNAKYAIVCSQFVQPGRDFRIGAALFTGSPGRGIQTVTARISTVSKGEKFDDLTAEKIWQRGEAAGDVTSVELTIAISGSPKNYDLVGSYNLSVTIQDTEGSVFRNSTTVTLSESPTVSLIQTDKAIYKPGQLVKFRIVNLDETLKPVPVDMEVFIKDAKGNLVDKQTHNLTELQAQQNQMVMTGEFRLSVMPNEGDWSITAKSALFTEVKTFNVRQYVLPKFTLELSVPSFVHVNDSEFTVGAKVQYTYDKAVEGEFSVTMGPFMNCRSCKSKYDLLETFSADAESNGEARFTFNLTNWREHLKSIGYTDRPYSYMAKASVQFKEKFTGEIKLLEKTFTIYTRSYELKVDTSQVAFFLPGFSVPIQITLTRPDNEPFTGTAASKAIASLVYHRRGKKQTLQFFNGRLAPSDTGTGASLVVKIPTEADFHPIRIEVKVDGDDSSQLQGSSTIYPFIGITDEYVKVKKRNLRDDDVEMELEKTPGISFVHYAVLSRNQIQRLGRFSDGDAATVRLTKTDLDSYVSDVTLVAFGVDRSGEIVASVAKHGASRLGGRVELLSNLTDNKGEPQQGASVSVRTAPNTFVFLTGIDASVNLLATGQDILQSVLAERYNSRIGGIRYWPRPQRLTTARILQENGLVVLSDGFYYTEHDNIESMYGQSRSRKMMGAADAMAPVPQMAMRSEIGGGGGKTQVRKFFPETMVWTVVQTDSEGRASHAFRLPDTVTSWHVTGFGVAADRQIQTMDAAFKLTTFKNFFVRPVLPYSLVRGEQFLLKVLAFNYRSIAGSVQVVVNISQPASQLPPVTVPLQANSAGLAVFELMPRSLPSLVLTIIATWTGESNSETDIVVKSIIVVPEGKTVYRSRTVLLTPPGNATGSNEQQVAVEFPSTNSSDLVPGSEVFSYSLIGDVTGPAMQNIGGLLRLPSGCGEQNMVNFAPAVFIWEYLTTTRQDTDSAVREKALQVMKVGLQRQLTYKRLDGSYSAFGQQDEAGSAWLTAFVLSIYSRAAAFITVGPDSLTGESVKFLLARQSLNGQFTELLDARILDPGLQGSSGAASHGLTAFTCLALLDVEEAAIRWPHLKSTTWKDTDIRSGITKCLWFVKSAFEASPSAFSSYDVALSAYLLRRAQASPTYRQASLERGLEALSEALEAQAETAPNGGGKFWSTANSWGWRRGSVEATGWAMLSYSMTTDRTDECLQILRWLSDQQTSLGGFSSSQATVVGIRAIAAFAASSGLASGDASVELQYGETLAAHEIQDSRRRVLQEAQPLRGASARVGSVQVRHTGLGTGFALAKLSWQFNLLDRSPLTASEWKSSEGLSIRLGLMPPKRPAKGQHLLAICARANTTVTGEGMLILRVTNPSGYSAGRLPEPSSASGLKRIEAGSQEIVLYFDYLPTDGACVTLQWTREVPVLKLSPQLISLQMYYNTDRLVSASYLAPELQEVTRCAACPECPGCDRTEPAAEVPREASWLNWLV